MRTQEASRAAPRGRAVISMLCSEIGRGHPFYLDGLHREVGAAVARRSLDCEVRRAGVFDVAGGLSRAAWTGVRKAYTIAGRGGLATDLYHRLRGTPRYDEDSPVLRLLARDLHEWAGETGPLVVDHPVLAGAMRRRANTWYIHGEMVAPTEAVVKSAARVLVPLEETAEAFASHGFEKGRLRVTGICVDPELVDDAAERAVRRRDRIAGSGPLTGAFFSSGAEPIPHVRAIAAAAASFVRGGHHAIVFAARGGRLERALGAPGAAAAATPGAAELQLVPFASRAELDRVTAERFSAFDFVVSPPHERSNWAVGLGIPFFLVGPDIGPFAPMNRRLLLRERVAAELAPMQAAAFPDLVDELRRTGELARMSGRGERRPIDGFRKAAAILLDEVAAS